MMNGEHIDRMEQSGQYPVPASTLDAAGAAGAAGAPSGAWEDELPRGMTSSRSSDRLDRLDAARPRLGRMSRENSHTDLRKLGAGGMGRLSRESSYSDLRNL